MAPLEDFEDLFDTAPCGYLSLSADGVIGHANQRIADWIGSTRADLVGCRLQEIMSVPSRIFFETNVAPLLRLQGFVDEVAMDLIGRARTKVPCLVNAAERRDAAGGLLFTRLTVFRATERRRYERALVDAADATERAAAAERETSELREQFIAVLGHDLRNPLASISSGVRLLTERETVTPRGRQILTLMQGSVIRASDLIDNVLDFARGRLGGGIILARDAQFALTPVLEQVVAELASVNPDRMIDARFAVDEPVGCDRVRLGQLLSNLLGNAIAHGAKGEPIIVRAQTRDGVLEIAVANGGKPIAEATMKRLFQPFFRGDGRSHKVGLGLGLHIASEIAKAHGGSLNVNSDVDETRFTFTMPLIESTCRS
ncbi:PAS domain-containing sensor histidine kinase [Sphingomonas naphthae]|uniref:histidine kinase n=1 Tax=Sphingomonas naphthae TaxID=1813468 RepID=A0ABY7TG72_9SPHN|nr:PAS domain-containing sensor histidine kinase [Sphingomonas naphthae]WCT72227.1 PAS domain-containing sensor histidine kinase [Sphingomonas naphthae]